MYKVLRFFNDVLDGLHAYKPGDEYPRKGYTPPPERIANLLGTQNNFGAPVIEEQRKRRKNAKQS